MRARFLVEAQATEHFDDPLLVRDRHLVERLAACGREAHADRTAIVRIGVARNQTFFFELIGNAGHVAPVTIKRRDSSVIFRPSG